MKNLAEILAMSRLFVSSSFQENYRALFEEEHLQTMAERLWLRYSRQEALAPQPPYLAEECTPSWENAYSCFASALQEYAQAAEENPHQQNAEVIEMFGQAWEQAGIENLLLVLGQRLTPASIRDARAIPPTQKVLLETAMQEHDQGLSLVARAWTKHTHRSQEEFWGEVKGGNREKNLAAETILRKILSQKTWWNVFGHYKHELVYEARLPSGHGARWGKLGQEFIGFLEPFSGQQQDQ